MTVSTAVDTSAVARCVGIKTEYQNLRDGQVASLPQRVAIFGQGNSDAVYSLDKFTIASSIDAANRYGFGSPVHLAARQLLPDNGDGVGSVPVTIYPLEDAPASVAASGSIEPVGVVTTPGVGYVLVNGEKSQAFSIGVGDTVATVVTAMAEAVNAILEMPVIAVDATPGTSTKLDLDAKWSGASGNGLLIGIELSGETGLTFGITQPTGGLVNPSLVDALALLGSTHETMLLNCLNYDDTTVLDEITSVGEGRWGPMERKPFMAFAGNTVADLTTAVTVSDSRPSDRINSQITAPGSPELPFCVAARALSRIARLANNTPPHDYGGQTLDGLIPGNDSEQWSYNQRDQAVKAGSSTIEMRDNIINLSDTVTFYHPNGDPTPAYRYVVDVVKVMTILYNVDLIFTQQEWNGAPLIPDGQPTTEPTAKTPSMAVAELHSLIDSLALRAIISEPAYAKSTVVAQISSENPKRLDVRFSCKISGNVNIISIDFYWGFYFGTSALAV